GKLFMGRKRGVHDGLFLQMVAEEDSHALMSVLRVGGTVAVLVIRVFEGMASIGVDFHVDGFADGFHGGGEVVHVVGGDALVEGSEVAEDGGADFFKCGGVGGERSVVDGDGAKLGVI